MLARREYEYTRHGTLGLFGNLHVATGEILSPLIRETRTEEDFLENIDGLVCTDADAQWRFITDNLNTHVSESLVRYVAAHCEIETDLGVKGRHGILKSQQSRRHFLTDKSPQAYERVVDRLLESQRFGERMTVVHCAYDELDAVLDELGWEAVDGMVPEVVDDGLDRVVLGADFNAFCHFQKTISAAV